MVRDQAVTVAGIGCRKGCAAEDILAAIAEALSAARRAPEALACLAAPDFKRTEAGLAEAARRLGLPIVFVDRMALDEALPRCPTRSEAALNATGHPSIAEGSALAAAGGGGVLVLPKIAGRGATCALAERRRP